MAIWKEPTTHKKEGHMSSSDPAVRKDAEPRSDFAASTGSSYAPPRQTPDRDVQESVVGAGLTIEGKIEGRGDIRVAGRFNGDVNVQGNLTIERGAKLVGGVTADTVAVSGELEGNISSASRVELRDTGVLTGDLKAGSLTVAAGSRMRGRVEFGWGDETASSSKKPALKMESGTAS